MPDQFRVLLLVQAVQVFRVRKHFRYSSGSVDLLFMKGTLRNPGVAAIVHIHRGGNGGAGLRGQALIVQRAEGEDPVVRRSCDDSATNLERLPNGQWGCDFITVSPFCGDRDACHPRSLP
jgi:hypothetical protein